MKATFKILLTLTGMLSAVFVTSSKLIASGQNKIKVSGMCKQSINVCGVGKDGTLFYGTWVEVISND